MGSCSLLQGIFPTRDQTWSPRLHEDSLPSEPPESPRMSDRVTYPFFRRSSQPRNQIRVPCIAGGFVTSWDTREAQVREAGPILQSRSFHPELRSSNNISRTQLSPWLLEGGILSLLLSFRKLAHLGEEDPFWENINARNASKLVAGILDTGHGTTRWLWQKECATLRPCREKKEIRELLTENKTHVQSNEMT